MAFIMANKGFWVSPGAAPSEKKKRGWDWNAVMAKETGLFHYELKLYKNSPEGDFSRHSSNDLQSFHSNILISLQTIYFCLSVLTDYC